MIHSIEQAEQFVKERFAGEASGHDWYHIDRVRRMALYICKKEGGNGQIVELAALLHDVPDVKLNKSMKEGKEQFLQILHALPLSHQEMQEVENIVLQISYKGGNEATLSKLEAKIVRDADRLDAIGAIGVARTFAYGGKKGNPLYDPTLTIRQNMSEETYRNEKTSTIHHFYEKLLNLKDLMLTQTGKEIAQNRHEFMESFLNQFYLEWNGDEFFK